MSDHIGQTVGDYRIESLIGTGSMARVYRGVHVHLNQAAAIKVLHPHLAADAGFRARFLREANAAAKLSHPHIVKVLGSGEQQGTAFLVMELASGGSLRALLQRHASSGQPLPWTAGVPLVRQAAEALDYAHGQGMVHRDIKPDNLLLQPMEGSAAMMAPPEAPFSVKICDFGVAQLRTDGRMASTGITVGTPAYISPEQCQGLEVDGRSDIYSLGIVLYEIATGYLPFETKSMAEALTKHVSTPPPPPRGVRPDLPADLEAAILRCLAKRPEERYENAGQLAAALQSVLASVTPPPRAAPSAEQLAVLSARPAAYDATVIPGMPVAPGAGGPSDPRASRRPQLLIMDSDGQAQRMVDLPEGGVVVGRARDTDLALEDPKVSRRHLRIDWDGREATVTDLGSGNGTWIDGTRLIPNEPQPWPAGAVLAVGPFGLRLDLTSGTASAVGRPLTLPPDGVSPPAAGNGRADPAAAPLRPAASTAPPAAPAPARPAAPPRPPSPPPAAPAAPAAPAVRSAPTRPGAPAAPSAAGAPAGSPRAQLLVAQKNGQMRPAAPLATGGLTVGRERDNQVVLADHQVSRHHLRIDWDGRQATIVDLGSGNGTWLNNVRLTPHVPQPWPDDAELRAGPFWLSLDPTGTFGKAADGRAAGGDRDFPFFNVVSSGAADQAPTTPRLAALDDSGQPLKEIDLPPGTVTIGRGKDNQLVLDDGERKVSRRHLQINWDGYHAAVTDFGSDNGTWLGEAKLVPDSPYPWPAEEWLRVGPFWLRLEMPVQPDQVDSSSGSLTAVGRVQMLLEERTVSFTPGQPTVVRGTVANLGNIVDHFHCTVEGVPKPWVSGDALRQEDNQKIQLNPGAQAPVALAVVPARTPESRAGDYLVNVLAHSTQNANELGVAQAVWTVLPFTGSALSLDRTRAGGRRSAAFHAIVENRGNAPVSFTLSAVDDERALNYKFDRDAIRLEPAQRATVPLTVQGSRYWMGIPQSRPFRVSVAPEEGDAPPSVMAEFVQHPIIPQWMPRAVGALIAPVLILVLLLQTPFVQGWLRPAIQFTAPSNVIERDPVTLIWDVQKANQIQIEGLDAASQAQATPPPGGPPPGGAPQGSPPPSAAGAAKPTPLPPRGTMTLGQGLSKDQEFKLIASNAFGETEQSRKVAVATFTPLPTATATATTPPTPTEAATATPAPVINDFRAEPPVINLGDQVTISWQVANADSVSISGLASAPPGALPASGTLTDRPSQTTIYRISGSRGGVPGGVREAQVIVRATPTPVPTPAPPTPTRPPA